MEGCIVENDGGVFRQLLEQMFGQPVVEPLSIGCAVEQDGSQQFCAMLCGDQAGARTGVATAVTINLRSDFPPAMRPVAAGGESAFIEIDEAMRPALTHHLA